ncbi:MDR family MFS transporter [Mangrovitalea sediminis]|uniref:MDR family MFS transporter n=1 Tax=Mangrovitalea sediminis TaxID=1982043 RepID=UPI00130403CA|nr:MDR family MFS transporter [Mangrovitalea sediminis]
MVVENQRTRFLITAVVMAAAILQILDTTIVTVALPHMQGQLGANTEQIGWVLTSYLISSGIFMPLTGFLTDRLGQKRYLTFSITGFVLTSMLCGIAGNLQEIVIFRLLQGIAGAGLVPTAQAVLINIYPREKRGQAMAIFGVGAMVGPILGPTLGGYLTEVLTWRWTFFINLPVGILALLGALFFIPETDTRERRIDWIGFSFLVLAVACMQYVLDQGQQQGWFQSHTIQIFTVLSAFGYLCLILRNLEMGPRAIFHLGVFKDRNFAVSVLILATFMFSMYGALALQPQMLESLLGYPALTTGIVLAPRGVGAMVSMFLAGRLINRVGAKPLIVCGFFCVLFSTWVTTWYTLQIDPWWIIWPIVLQGFGLGMVFVPLATVSFATLPEEWSAEAAGVRQLGRTIGASLGVSVSGAVMAHQSQVAWHQYGGHITATSDAVRQYLAPLHLSPDSREAAAVLGHLLRLQADFHGLLNAFEVMALTVVLGFPLLLLISRNAGKEGRGKAA